MLPVAITQGMTFFKSSLDLHLHVFAGLWSASGLTARCMAPAKPSCAGWEIWGKTEGLAYWIKFSLLVLMH